MCQLHFTPCDIRKQSAALDEKTGKTIHVELKVPRLEEGAITTVTKLSSGRQSSRSDFLIYGGCGFVLLLVDVVIVDIHQRNY